MGKNNLETSHGHKKEKNGKIKEIPLDKLSKVDCEKQTTKEKEVLQEFTKKSVANH